MSEESSITTESADEDSSNEAYFTCEEENTLKNQTRMTGTTSSVVDELSKRDVRAADDIPVVGGMAISDGERANNEISGYQHIADQQISECQIHCLDDDSEQLAEDEDRTGDESIEIVSISEKLLPKPKFQVKIEEITDEDLVANERDPFREVDEVRQQEDPKVSDQKLPTMARADTALDAGLNNDSMAPRPSQQLQGARKTEVDLGEETVVKEEPSVTNASISAQPSLGQVQPVTGEEFGTDEEFVIDEKSVTGEELGKDEEFCANKELSRDEETLAEELQARTLKEKRLEECFTAWANDFSAAFPKSPAPDPTSEAQPTRTEKALTQEVTTQGRTKSPQSIQELPFGAVRLPTAAIEDADSYWNTKANWNSWHWPFESTSGDNVRDPGLNHSWSTQEQLVPPCPGTSRMTFFPRWENRCYGSNMVTYQSITAYIGYQQYSFEVSWRSLDLPAATLTLK